MSEVGEMRAGKGGRKMMVERSPPYSSQSNGEVERAVRSVVEMARVLRSALEERWRTKIPPEHAIWPWIVEWGAWLLNRLEVGKDGRTAYEEQGEEGEVDGI